MHHHVLSWRHSTIYASHQILTSGREILDESTRLIRFWFRNNFGGLHEKNVVHLPSSLHSIHFHSIYLFLDFVSHPQISFFRPMINHTRDIKNMWIGVGWVYRLENRLLEDRKLSFDLGANMGPSQITWVELRERDTVSYIKVNYQCKLMVSYQIKKTKKKKKKKVRGLDEESITET